MNDDDLAPDSDEPGDTEVQEPLKGLIHDDEIVPDNVDEEG